MTEGARAALTAIVTTALYIAAAALSAAWIDRMLPHDLKFAAAVFLLLGGGVAWYAILRWVAQRFGID